MSYTFSIVSNRRGKVKHYDIRKLDIGKDRGSVSLNMLPNIFNSPSNIFNSLSNIFHIILKLILDIYISS